MRSAGRGAYVAAFSVIGALACDLDMHAPSILSDRLCPRVPIATFTVPKTEAEHPECWLLVSTDGALFRLETSDSCGGPAELCVHPGETAYALALIRPHDPISWVVYTGNCADIC